MDLLLLSAACLHVLCGRSIGRVEARRRVESDMGGGFIPRNNCDFGTSGSLHAQRISFECRLELSGGRGAWTRTRWYQQRDLGL